MIAASLEEATQAAINPTELSDTRTAHVGLCLDASRAVLRLGKAGGTFMASLDMSATRPGRR